MPHTNEGTLHALLDGELPPEEQREVELHLEECAECARRRDEARQFMVGADLLLEGLDHLDPAGPSPNPDAVPVGDAEKLILFPFPPENVHQPPRRFPWAALVWIVSIAVAVGAGYVLSQNRNPVGDRTGGQSTAVVSDLERQQAQAPAPAPAPLTPPSVQPADTFATADTALTGLAADAADSEFDSTGDETELAQTPPPVPKRQPAQQQPAQRQPESSTSASRPRTVPPPAPAQQSEPAPNDVAANPAPGSVDTQTSPPPQPVSNPEANLERRSGIYLRIGLDEARRMLGSPLHVIDGLRPQFIGMVAAGRAPGADPTRPAIRVVYLDAAQRMILLDQQRLPIGDSGRDRPRQPTITSSPAGPVAGWVKGDVWLALHGVSADALQDLAGRVR
ncbi:MAG TPA: zf-HC2 domain-containing protein [Gemmatimonadales bacterium]|nr:zf-HC2 domain-containing protein [Gemmatimonadales bacterium]